MISSIADFDKLPVPEKNISNLSTVYNFLQYAINTSVKPGLTPTNCITLKRCFLNYHLIVELLVLSHIFPKYLNNEHDILNSF